MIFKRSKTRRPARKSSRRLGGEPLENRNLMTGLAIGAGLELPLPAPNHLTPILQAPNSSDAGIGSRANDDADVPDSLIWDIDIAGASERGDGGDGDDDIDIILWNVVG